MVAGSPTPAARTGPSSPIHKRSLTPESTKERKASPKGTGGFSQAGLTRPPQLTRPPVPHRAARAEKEVGQGASDCTSVLVAVERLVQEGQELAQEEAWASAAGMPPARGLRLRRKSRDLMEEAIDMLTPDLERAFKQFDVDGSGTLSQGELKAAFEAAGRPASGKTIKEAFLRLDTNNDGVVSLEEFKALSWQLAVAPRER